MAENPVSARRQEQKRQRLREAGRRKLEEFKLRNVESLPSLPQLGTRSFNGAGFSPPPGVYSFLDCSRRSPQVSASAN